MKLILVTDAWLPQINGVVRSLQKVTEQMIRLGHEVEVIHPDQFFTIPCPSYPEIPLAVGRKQKLVQRFAKRDFDAVHITTEGPLGLTARRICLRLGIPFTTAYHTKFPEYIYERYLIPVRLTKTALRWFHSKSSAVMVATKSLYDDLETAGFKNLTYWTRGVDTELFNPYYEKDFELPKPISLYVGRVAVEKNITDFLDLDIGGTKIVVGDGPQLAELRQRYPDVRFVGFKSGQELAYFYSLADVFVFPSKTDTFGLVLLEALASGTPIAAYPVTGPNDIIGDVGPGGLDWDLRIAVQKALCVSPEHCRSFALQYSWERSAKQFLSNLQTIPEVSPLRLVPGTFLEPARAQTSLRT